MKPALDITLGDAWARDLRRNLERGDWKPVQKFLEATRGWEQRDFYVGVFAEWKGRPPWLDAWCEGASGSAIPWLVRGAHGVRWAWEARGSSTAEKVQGSAWPAFFERLEGAEADLGKAAELDPADPTPWSWLITTAIGRQQETAVRRQRFEEARRRDPTCLSAHARLLNGLTWKWGGSHEEMFSFAREASAAAAQGSPLHSLVARAHVERWLAFGMEQHEEGLKTYLRTPEAVRDVEQAWARSVGSARARPFLGGIGERNLFAFCFWQQKEPGKARRELQATRGIVTETPWGYAGDPLTVFGEALQETGDTPSPDPALAERVQHYCREAIQTAAKDFRITLDYGEAGVAAVDKILGVFVEHLRRAPAEQAQRAAAGMSLEYGTYLGEILRRKLGGTWTTKVPGREEGDLSVRVGTTYLLPLVTVYRRLTQPQPPSVVQSFEKWVQAQLHPPPPAPRAPEAAPAAAPQPPRTVADDMRALAEQAVKNARLLLGRELDYSEPSAAVVDRVMEQLRQQAAAAPAERKRILDLGALELGAYLGEVLRSHRGGIWIKDEPGLPPGLPVLSLGHEHAITIAAAREFLEGRGVDMAGRTVTTASQYLELVIARQQSWLDRTLFGSAAGRDALKSAMSDDAGLAEELLGYAESAVLTAATRWGLILDFSEKSLEGVEQVLSRFHEAARCAAGATPAETVRRAAIVWGTYVGEVLRRHLGGRWTNTPVPPQGPVLRLRIGNAEVYPLRKVEKRILEGPGDAIPFYFQATRKIAAGRPPA
jgi:hypothetical protein